MSGRCGTADNHEVKTIALCALGLSLTALCLTQRPRSADDFRAFYRGAQLVGTPDGVYSHPTRIPETNEPGTYLPYIRIPSYALLLKPLTVLPYAIARKIWVGLIVLAFAALIPLYSGHRDKLAIALCFSLPVVYAVMLAQDIAFVLLIALVASRVAASHRPFLAGLAASLLAIKPVYLLPVGVVFLARSRRGTYGLALGTAIQLTISFLLEGPRWPLEYLAVLRSPLFDPEPRRMLNVRAIGAALNLPPQFYIPASIALLIGLWMIARRLELPDALIAALPLGMLASPHSIVYEGVVIIPLLVSMFARHSREELVYFLALTPLPYLALMTNQVHLVLAGSATVVIATALAASQSYRNVAGNRPAFATGSQPTLIAGC